MISGLGLSSLSSNSRDHGMLAYVEPQCFKVNDYIRDKKSDIYSLGVLLWEITSGYPPLSKIPDQNTLDYKISNGCREQPISNTPPAYVNLYQKCWEDEPSLRPAIDDVFDMLEEITLQFNTDNISNKDIEKELVKCYVRYTMHDFK
jgi:serine/threonine protein kinase